MDFLKKHYEKLVLSVVLLAVAVAAFLLTVEVGNVKQTLAEQLEQKIIRKGAPLPPLNLTTNEAAASRASASVKVVLDGEHNTFNPGAWEKSNEGLRRKPGKAGLAGLTIARVIPLNLVIGFTGVAGTEEAPRYQLSVAREFEKLPAKRRATITSLNAGAKDSLLQIIDVKGPKMDPTEILCELMETRERFVLTKEKTFRKTYAYAADLRSEGKEFPGKRVDDPLVLSGVTYKIVAIGKDELVVSAPNQVRTTIAAVTAQ
jgi:hypothetical protein